MGVLQRTLSPLSLPTASTFNGGIYLLVAELKRGCSLSVGRLGRHFFPKGFYLYVGSAQTNLVQRLRRHLAENPTGKRPHWHIDYLLAHARIRYIWGFAAPKEWECRLGRRLAGLSGLEIPLNGFGSSDCHCDTHLYYFSNRKHTLLSTDMFERVYPKRFRNFCYNNDRFSHT
ncbi:MAG: GIY-YIG nuclease family protein [Candidatus Brocadiales bacterium]